MSSVIDHARHTPYSDPGRHAGLLADLPTDPDGVSAVARNLVVHYRASGLELPAATRGDIDSRWLEAILDADQGRHPWPLTEPRPRLDAVQGCCRDHTLFCLGVLRTHGVPARSRVGFAGYFVEGWHHDHVIVEAWIDGRWRRFDPEVDAARPGLPSPMDIGPCGPDGRGFTTAAEAWIAHRRGDVDASRYGVDPLVPLLNGPRFLFEEVVHEVAHRFGDELLLWDGWGRMGRPGQAVGEADAAWLDVVAALLVAADAGDGEAERELLRRYRADEGLRPGPTVVQSSPFGDPPKTVRLDRRRPARDLRPGTGAGPRR